jgi:hypothetical protein
VSRPGSRRRLLAQVALVAAGVLLGVYVHRVLLVPHPPLSADEAGHALPAARMALALGDGSLRGFLDATRREVVWPFLHPWLMTPLFLAFGISTHVARVFSLLAFGAALGLVPILARELEIAADADTGPGRVFPSLPTMGWLSVAVLIAGAPWELVCTVMSEPLGMLSTLAVLVVEARASRQPGRAWPFVTGLLVAATFFTKYSYGLPLMAALVLARGGRGRRDDRESMAAMLAGMFLPIGLWLVWLLGPDPSRAGELLAAFVNRDEGLHGLADWFFYGQAIVATVGRPVALATLLIWVAVLAHRRLGQRLPSILFVAASLAMLTLHPNKQARYLFTTLPVVLVLAETELAHRLRRLGGREVLWPVLATVLLVARNPVAEIRQAAASAARLQEARPLLGYIAENVSGRQPVLFLGTTGLLPHLALTWELLERQQREPAVELLLFPRPGAGAAAYRTGYPAENGPEYGAALQRALGSGRFRSVVTLELGPRSPFLPDWLAKWDAFGQNYVRAMAAPESQADYLLASERAFPASDATVRIFVRREAGAGGSDLARSSDRSD